MTWLLLLAMLLVVAALIAHVAARKAAAVSGLPGGGIRYQDTCGAVVPCETLVSTRYGLVGRPDYIVETSSGLVPVEIKSSPAPLLGPYDNHVAQFLGYCLLVEDAMGRPVAEGILKCCDRDVHVLLTPERRERILAIVAAMQEARSGRPVCRSHEQVNKCRGCSVRSSCWDKIE